MKERPILFSGPMVRAILEGRKTQTRRVVKPQPLTELEAAVLRDSATYWSVQFRRRIPFKSHDRLWVRETWRFDHSESDVYYRADDSCRRFLDREIDDWADKDWKKPHRHAQWAARWRPSIFMPRWACRLELAVTGVRVERLREIGEADAEAEGVPDEYIDRLLDAGCDIGFSPSDPWRQGFERLWDSINESRGFGWSTNPWVWVVEFERAK